MCATTSITKFNYTFKIRYLMRRSKIVLLLCSLIVITCFMWLIISNYGFLICKLMPDGGKRFNSLAELVDFLRSDDLNEREPSAGYTCVEFVKDFINRAQAKGYCDVFSTRCLGTI